MILKQLSFGITEKSLPFGKITEPDSKVLADEKDSRNKDKNKRQQEA